MVKQSDLDKLFQGIEEIIPRDDFMESEFQNALFRISKRSKLE